MRAVISITVAVVVALHTVLGCCWHHAHEAAAGVIEREAASAEPVAKRSCGHGHADEAKSVAHDSAEHDASEHDSHGSCPEPCDAKCDALALTRVQHDGVAALSVFAWVATVAQPVRSTAVLDAKAGRLDEQAPPPIRLHLLHQLLLI